MVLDSESLVLKFCFFCFLVFSKVFAHHWSCHSGFFVFFGFPDGFSSPSGLRTWFPLVCLVFPMVFACTTAPKPSCVPSLVGAIRFSRFPSGLALMREPLQLAGVRPNWKGMGTCMHTARRNIPKASELMTHELLHGAAEAARSSEPSSHVREGYPSIVWDFII